MKKILIFSSIGGGGHVSIVHALRSSLEHNYSIQSVETFQDVLFTNSYFKGAYCPIKCYNYFLQKNKLYLCNIFARIATFVFNYRTNNFIDIFYAYLVQEKPDLIISVIPFVNYYISTAAQKLSIPFLIVSSDLDISLYLSNVKKSIYDNIYVALPFESELNNQKLMQVGIPESAIFVVGASVRDSFMQPKDKVLLKKKWEVDNGLPILLVMMGAQGSQSLIDYCRQLTDIKTPLHIFVCIGKNKLLKKRIEALTFPSTATIHIIEFTPVIDELMAIADILITKSGSISVCEALYSGLPLLLDAVSTTLSLERFNHDFVAQHGFGELLTYLKGVSSRIDYLLAHPEILAHMRRCMRNFKKKNSQHEIPLLISHILK